MRFGVSGRALMSPPRHTTRLRHTTPPQHATFLRHATPPRHMAPGRSGVAAPTPAPCAAAPPHPVRVHGAARSWPPPSRPDPSRWGTSPGATRRAPYRPRQRLRPAQRPVPVGFQPLAGRGAPRLPATQAPAPRAAVAPVAGLRAGCGRDAARPVRRRPRRPHGAARAPPLHRPRERRPGVARARRAAPPAAPSSERRRGRRSPGLDPRRAGPLGRRRGGGGRRARGTAP